MALHDLPASQETLARHLGSIGIGIMAAILYSQNDEFDVPMACAKAEDIWDLVKPREETRI